MLNQRFGVYDRATGALVAERTLRVRGPVLEGHLDGPVHIPAGETWLLGRVRTSHNVVVEGRLVARPELGSDLWFDGVDESRFVGGHVHHPVASDVGLWVVGGGVLDFRGTPKTPWTRALMPLLKGQRSILVEDATGWRPGDLVAVTPTIPPTPDSGKLHQDVNHALAYDEELVERVDGNVVTLAAPLRFDHPAVAVRMPDGGERLFHAEVLNLSRDVKVRGGPLGRAHVMLQGVGPQHIAHVEFAWMGPRQGNAGVTGRYGLHFHMCGDGARGSSVTGVVVRECGTHAFVPHASHGIVFDGCIAHGVRGDAYWWDPPSVDPVHHETHDTQWVRCVASKVQVWEKDAEGFRMGGFNLGDGKDGSNRLIDCVAVGVCEVNRATFNSSTDAGVVWTSDGRAIWQVENLVTHNNGGAGTFAWQNDENIHITRGVVAYHNGTYGIEHGAYSNFWRYEGCALHGNRRAGLAVHAVTRATNTTIRYYPKPWPKLTFERFAISGSPFGVTSPGHVLAVHWDRDGWTDLVDFRIYDCAVGHFEPSLEKGSWLRFTRLFMDRVGVPWRFAPGVAANVRVDVMDDGVTLRAPGWPEPGVVDPDWGAKVVVMDRFIPHGVVDSLRLSRYK